MLNGNKQKCQNGWEEAANLCMAQTASWHVCQLSTKNNPEDGVKWFGPCKLPPNGNWGWGQRCSGPSPSSAVIRAEEHQVSSPGVTTSLKPSLQWPHNYRIYFLCEARLVPSLQTLRKQLKTELQDRQDFNLSFSTFPPTHDVLSFSAPGLFCLLIVLFYLIAFLRTLLLYFYNTVNCHWAGLRQALEWQGINTLNKFTHMFINLFRTFLTNSSSMELSVAYIIPSTITFSEQPCQVG